MQVRMQYHWNWLNTANTKQRKKRQHDECRVYGLLFPLEDKGVYDVELLLIVFVHCPHMELTQFLTIHRSHHRTLQNNANMGYMIRRRKGWSRPTFRF